jgi:hypothetical protein
MVTLPPEFTATRYPGYFWNTKDNRLYSIKVAGVLRPLVRQRANRYNDGFAGYNVSVKGEKRYMREEILMKLTPKNSVIPVQLTLF